MHRIRTGELITPASTRREKARQLARALSMYSFLSNGDAPSEDFFYPPIPASKDTYHNFYLFSLCYSRTMKPDATGIVADKTLPKLCAITIAATVIVIVLQTARRFGAHRLTPAP